MKKYIFKGFWIYLLCSIIINSVKVWPLNHDPELLSVDLLHLIPALVFDEFSDQFLSIKEVLLIPIAFTDGFIGALTGVTLGMILTKVNLKGFFYPLLLTAYIFFQFVFLSFIPIFES